MTVHRDQGTQTKQELIKAMKELIASYNQKINQAYTKRQDTDLFFSDF